MLLAVDFRNEYIIIILYREKQEKNGPVHFAANYLLAFAYSHFVCAKREQLGFALQENV